MEERDRGNKMKDTVQKVVQYDEHTEELPEGP